MQKDMHKGLPNSMLQILTFTFIIPKTDLHIDAADSYAVINIFYI